MEQATILDFNDTKEREQQPLVIDCDREAKEYYIKWHDQLALEAWLGTEEDEDSMLAKLRGQCLRIALQLHAMDAILDEKAIDAPLSLDVMTRACGLADWLKAHQRHAWKMLKGAAAMPTGRELRVCEAIVALESEIVKGFLPTARIVETVNGSTDERFHMTPEAVGKVCSKLGLEGARTGQQKGWSVSPDDIARFMKFLETTGTTGKPGKSEERQGFPGMPVENRTGTTGTDENATEREPTGTTGKTVTDPEDVEVF
ncbi:DUF3987 domain-containing protein [Desulfonatronum thiodismutans]|uniref:DUF3987 domain-containing protein n=1 Tax=Desulfonatronum thiodismutans TaxID=159290 RepID=UPI0004ABE2A1|nr:DUF3987 domain-containing protein [Desulfonatronum thiodismutans]